VQIQVLQSAPVNSLFPDFMLSDIQRKKDLRHVVLVNPLLSGIEYGMLRDFEDEIVRVTGAEQLSSPRRSLPRVLDRRLEHGTRYSGFRQWVPKEAHEIVADVLWVPLMGPESFTLDLYKGWDKNIGIKILYLFDTYDAQLPSIRRVLRATDWDFVSTAFHGAKPWLEEETQREWHLVRHAVKLSRFRLASDQARVIDFCAYGRRHEKVHQAVKEYCALDGKYYDYTTSASVQPHLDARDHYKQYAWHLAHSIFNFCWPVEVTHPGRLKTHSPITCRWFEAAASANVIVGRAPTDPGFNEIFGADAVIEIDHVNGNLASLCEALWVNRESYLQGALKRRASLSAKWSWESRIDEILGSLGIPKPEGVIQSSFRESSILSA
jgi:hypothetical protein